MGPCQRARHRCRLGAARCDHREPLVRDPTRPRHRLDDGELCIGPRHSYRRSRGSPASTGARPLCRSQSSRCSSSCLSCSGSCATGPRTSGSPVRRGRELAAAAVADAPAFGAALDALSLALRSGVLAPRRDVLRLRCHHERAHVDAPDPGGPRPRHRADHRASLLALIGVFDVVGTTASGWLTDRYDPRKLLLAYYGLRSALTARAASGLRLGQCCHTRLRRRLRPRLGGDGTADLRALDSSLRPAGRHRLRLDLRRASTRRGGRRVGRRAGSAPRPATTPRPSSPPAGSRSSPLWRCR